MSAAEAAALLASHKPAMQPEQPKLQQSEAAAAAPPATARGPSPAASAPPAAGPAAQAPAAAPPAAAKVTGNQDGAGGGDGGGGPAAVGSNGTGGNNGSREVLHISFTQDPPDSFQMGAHFLACIPFPFITIRTERLEVCVLVHGDGCGQSTRLCHCSLDSAVGWTGRSQTRQQKEQPGFLTMPWSLSCEVCFGGR